MSTFATSNVTCDHYTIRGGGNKSTYSWRKGTGIPGYTGYIPSHECKIPGKDEQRTGKIPSLAHSAMQLETSRKEKGFHHSVQESSFKMEPEYRDVEEDKEDMGWNSGDVRFTAVALPKNAVPPASSPTVGKAPMTKSSNPFFQVSTLFRQAVQVSSCCTQALSVGLCPAYAEWAA
jgi:hypothetical protein